MRHEDPSTGFLGSEVPGQGAAIGVGQQTREHEVRYRGNVPRQPVDPHQRPQPFRNKAGIDLAHPHREYVGCGPGRFHPPRFGQPGLGEEDDHTVEVSGRRTDHCDTGCAEQLGQRAGAVRIRDMEEQRDPDGYDRLPVRHLPIPSSWANPCLTRDASPFRHRRRFAHSARAGPTTACWGSSWCCSLERAKSEQADHPDTGCGSLWNCWTLSLAPHRDLDGR